MNTCIAAETGCFHQTTRSHLDPGGHHFAESCDSLTRDHCAQQWVHGSLLHTISIQCFDFLWKVYSHRILQFTLHRVRAVGTIASESLDLGREIEREAAWAPARISVISCSLHKPCFYCQQHPLFPKSPFPTSCGTSVPLSHPRHRHVASVELDECVHRPSSTLRLPDVMACLEATPSLVGLFDTRSCFE